MTPQYTVVHAFIRLLIKVCFRVQVIGREHIPKGNYVIVANHLNWLDPLLILVAFPTRPRIWFLAARDIVWTSPFARRLFTFTGGVIPMSRGRQTADRDALSIVRAVLGNGSVICLFPEGHVGFFEGRIRPFKPGAAMLAARAGVPVVPVGIVGSTDLWLRKRIVLTIGMPMASHVDVPQLDRRLLREWTADYERSVWHLLRRDGVDGSGNNGRTLKPANRWLNPWAKNAPLVPHPEPISIASLRY